MLRNAVLDSLTFSCRFGSGIGLRLPRVRRNLLTTRSNASGSDRDLTTTQRQPQTASLLDGGKRVAVQSSGNTVQYHGAWLRHNCQCDQCLNRDCNQKFVHHTLLRDVAVTDVTISDNDVYFTWRNTAGEHTGHISLDWLLEHRYSTERIRELAELTRPNKTCQGTLPEVCFESVLNSDQDVWRWLHHLNETGMCMVTNVPSCEGMVAMLAERVGPIQETVYGKTFHLLSTPNAMNIAYTGEALSLHVDQLYLESPPGLSMMHCLRNDDDVIGGESLFLDANPIVEKMRKDYPMEFSTLTQIPATFQQMQDSKEESVCMWRQRTHIVLGANEEVIGFNWAPVAEGPLCAAEEDVKPYYAAYHVLAELLNTSDHMIQFRLPPGQIISFNNRRVLHGRTAFQQKSGIRHFEGVYVFADAFRSKFAVLNNRYGGLATVKRIFDYTIL